MAYGSVKVDTIIFDNGGSDQNVTVSGLYRATTSGLTVSGTLAADIVSGVTVIGSTTVSSVTVIGSTTVSGATVTGTVIQGTTVQGISGTFTSVTGTTGTFTSLTGTTGTFTSLTGTTTAGTTANFVSGVFTTQVSGATITGTTSSFTSGNFTTLSGATATFTSGVITSGTVTNPSLSFQGDPNTGLYSPGADQLGIVTAGSERLRLGDAGQLGLSGANYGTAGQVLTSNGGVSAPTWETGSFPSGTVMLFQQTSAPPGWTKLTTHDNKALRVVSGTASTGGSTAFTSVFASRTPTGSVSGSNSGGGVSAHTLTTAQMPSHNHTQHGQSASAGNPHPGGSGSAFNGPATSSTGGGGSHTHGFTQPSWSGAFSGAAMDFAVAYVDVIFASKN
jgi:hypothetical protein